MIQTKQTLRQRIATGMIWLGGLASLAGLSGCGPITYADPYEGWTPEQRQSWMDYMERDKQKKEQQARADMDYMKREADRLNSQQIIILQKPDQQPNIEKNIEEAATRGAGNFIGEVLIREYLK